MPAQMFGGDDQVLVAGQRARPGTTAAGPRPTESPAPAGDCGARTTSRVDLLPAEPHLLPRLLLGGSGDDVGPDREPGGAAERAAASRGPGRTCARRSSGCSSHER